MAGMGPDASTADTTGTGRTWAVPAALTPWAVSGSECGPDCYCDSGIGSAYDSGIHLWSVFSGRSSSLQMDDIDWESWGLIRPTLGFAGDDPQLGESRAEDAEARAALHDEIIASQLDSVAPASGRPRLVILGGGAGSGKTTLLQLLRRNGHAPEAGSCVEVNPDALKEHLPEFRRLQQANDARAAAVVHEESSRLRHRLMDAALAKGADIVLDVTMANRARGLKAIGEAQKNDYDVSLFAATIGAELAVYRTVRRGLATGRHVPIASVIISHKGFSQAFPGYLRVLPHVELWDMEIQESEPIYKWEGGSERIRHTIPYGRFLKKTSLNVDARRPEELYEQTSIQA